mmetsp:Transcript_3495/g.6583  ORF Transcript_3495/g.6583 Transcript_3495/m.6583 type:complete len:490 (-) Transcript_3495:155-1624(-)
MVGSLPSIGYKVSIARRNRLTATVAEVIFGSNAQHWPIIKPFNFIVLEQLSKLLVKLVCMIPSMVHGSHTVVKFLFLLHFLALFGNPCVPVLLFCRCPVGLFHKYLDVGMIGVVLELVIMKNDVLCCLELGASFGCIGAGSIHFLHLASKIPFEGKAAGVGRFNWVQATFLSHFIFFASPLTNDFVKVTIRCGIFVGLHKDADCSHLVVDASLRRRDRVKMLELNFSIVPFPILGMFRRGVNVNVRKMPPLRKSFTVIDPSKSRPLSWNATIQRDSIPNAVGIVVEIVINGNGLRDPKGVSFNSKGIGVNELIPRTKGVFVLHPMHVDAFVGTLMSTRFEADFSFQINRRLMMTAASLVGTPSTIIFRNRPVSSGFPLVTVSQTFVEFASFVAGNVVPILWSIIDELIRTSDIFVLVRESIEVATIVAVLGRHDWDDKSRQDDKEEPQRAAMDVTLDRCSCWCCHGFQVNCLKVKEGRNRSINRCKPKK